MSDIVPHKRALRRDGRLRRVHSRAEVIEYKPGEPPEIQFVDGSRGRGTCLGCHDAPCMEITKAQSRPDDRLGAFPTDPSRNVCPTDAIDWNNAAGRPSIDREGCIGCGLCAVRCPYGAITLSPDGVALIEGSDPDGITVPDTGASGPHLIIPRTGTLGSLAAPFARGMPNIVTTLTDTQGTLLARNMLTACGVTASMRRRGDTNIRMDGILRFASSQIGVVELETGAAVLESPRALLEDIAVLHSRFAVPIAEIIPVSLIGALPNVRGEYYRVIDDIAKVLDIQCRTLTLGVLCVLMWRFRMLDGIAGDLFTTKTGATDFHSSLVQLVPDLPRPEPYPGAYRPSK